MEMEQRARMATTKSLALLLGLSLAGYSFAQSTGKTVRHHTVAAQENSQSSDLAKAETLLEKKDLPAAEMLLQKVTAAEPSNYVAWFDLGFAQNGLGKTADSIASYKNSVDLKPDVFESNLNLGLTMAKAGLPEAEKYLAAATSLKPTAHVEEGQARAWLSLGHVLEKSDPDRALEAFRNAVKLQPNDPEPHLSAGQLLEAKNQLSDAEQEYKQVLALQPDSSDALAGIANIYMRAQKFSDAEEMLQKFLALHPKDAAAHLQLGRVLVAASKYDDAITQFQSALRVDPKDVGAQRDLADAYVSAGKYDVAALQYQNLLGTLPNDAELHHSLGQAFLKQSKFPEAQQEFMTAVKLKPDFGAAYGNLAIAADKNKNYELVIKALDVRAKLLPEIPVGYFLRATAYDHLRDYKDASENYHKFLDVAGSKYPDQEWQARHRLIAIEKKK
jgi:tetratricopeptide (TPR) repeat protein